MTSARGKAYLALYFLIGLGQAALYQNCAPAGSFGSSGSSASFSVGAESGSDDFPVSVIDPIDDDAGIAFAKAEYVASGASASAIELAGVCDLKQSGAILRWTLRDPAVRPSGRPAGRLADDAVECRDGEFRFSIPARLFPACGHAYEVQAQLGIGKPGEAIIRGACGDRS